MDGIASCFEGGGNGGNDSGGQLSMMFMMQQRMSQQHHMQQFQTMQMQIAQFQQSIQNQIDAIECHERKSKQVLKSLLKSNNFKKMESDLDDNSIRGDE